MHQRILVNKIIPDFQSEPIIAKVEVMKIITKVTIVNSRNYKLINAEAKVVEAIKGSEVGQIISIRANPSLCGGGLNEKDVGKQGFIAGLIVEGLFTSGIWTNEIVEKYGN